MLLKSASLARLLANYNHTTLDWEKVMWRNLTFGGNLGLINRQHNFTFSLAVMRHNASLDVVWLHEGEQNLTYFHQKFHHEL